MLIINPIRFISQISNRSHGKLQDLDKDDHSAYPLYRKGLDANRTAAGRAGRLYYATDTKKLYWDTGSTWITLREDSLLYLNDTPSSYSGNKNKAVLVNNAEDGFVFEYAKLPTLDVVAYGSINEGEAVKYVTREDPILSITDNGNYEGLDSSTSKIRQKADLTGESFYKVAISLNGGSSGFFLKLYDDTLTQLEEHYLSPSSGGEVVVTLDSTYSDGVFYLEASYDGEFVDIMKNTNDPYSYSDLELYDGSWTTKTGEDMYMKFITEYKSTEAEKLSNSSPDAYVGIANNSVSDGGTVTIVIGGTKEMTGWNLSPGNWYFISDTDGVIQNKPGTNEKVVGYAIDSDILLVL